MAPVFLLVVVLCTVALSAHLVVSPPTFNTDLGDFAPDSEARDAHDRIHEYFPNEARPMFVHVTADDGSNILSIDNLKLMDEHLSHMENASEKRQDAVDVWTTAPGIVQLALDEEGNGTSLNAITSWTEILDLLFDDDTECTLTADDQLLSAARYASSALLNTDLNIDDTCSYLKDG
ncbi:MAG: hypothetical protein CL988_04190, partial [Euryarchaeota archaeon]|nr:hypothetical protein [Euryarchaeota archaeon]